MARGQMQQKSAQNIVHFMIHLLPRMINTFREFITVSEIVEAGAIYVMVYQATSYYFI